MSIDWGYTHQTAALWAIDLGERAYVYRERGYTGTDPVSLGMYLAEVNGDERVQNVYLSPDAFAIGKKAKSADVHILYKDGDIRYDKDGQGGKAAVLFAKVGPKLDIDADDFLVI